MLVLQQRTGDQIRIETSDGPIVINTVNLGFGEHRGYWVRLGFQADKRIRIMRQEVLDRDASRTNLKDES